MKKDDFKPFDVADSMAAAAARLDVPLETVKRMKRAGCAAFKGSRVGLRALSEAIAADVEPDTILFPIPTGPESKPKVIEEFRNLLRAAIRCRWLTTAEILEVILAQIIEALDKKLEADDFYKLTQAIHNGFGAAVMVLEPDPATDEFLRKSAAALTRAKHRSHSPRKRNSS